MTETEKEFITLNGMTKRDGAERLASAIKAVLSNDDLFYFEDSKSPIDFINGGNILTCEYRNSHFSIKPSHLEEQYYDFEFKLDPAELNVNDVITIYEVAKFQSELLVEVDVDGTTNTYFRTKKINVTFG